MVMIITTHCISSSKAFSVFQPNTIQYVILSFVQTLANYGVNLFVLITGWFMIEKTSISVRKVARILLDVAFYGIIIYLISVLIGINVLSLRGLIKAAFPLLFGYRWFVLAYCVLFVLIPYINAMLRHLTQAQYGTLLIICFVLFSVWPTFLPNPPIDHYGYSFLHLIFMYILAGYARKYIHDISSGCNLLLLLILQIRTGFLTSRLIHAMMNNGLCSGNSRIIPLRNHIPQLQFIGESVIMTVSWL